MSAAAHQAVLREKDQGAFDGKSWLVRGRRKDGALIERCVGPCDDPKLRAFLDSFVPLNSE